MNDLEETDHPQHDPYWDLYPAGGIPRRARTALTAFGLAATLGIGYMLGHQAVPDAPAVIGKDRVPVGLHCQEGEVISLVGRVGPPSCVSVGEIAGFLGSDQVQVNGRTYAVDDPGRPGCFAEPSETPEGVEVILYSRISDKTSLEGVEVPC